MPALIIPINFCNFVTIRVTIPIFNDTNQTLDAQSVLAGRLVDYRLELGSDFGALSYRF